jgi:hypothetical protein
MKLRVSDSSFAHHQELCTVHSAVVYAIQVCRQLSSSSRIRMGLQLQIHPGPAARVEFNFRNKFEKLVHLVGFFIR